MSRMWPCLLSLIGLVLSGLGDDSGTGGAGRCRRPAGEGMIPAELEFYNVSDSLTVQCATGYYPSQETIICINGQTGHQWDPSPRCTAQCRRPDGEGVIPAGKEFYNKDEDLYMRCQDGYRLISYMWTRCTSPRTDNEWQPSPQCVAQCKKPVDTELYKTSGEKPYYNVRESVSVQCRTGYRPLHEAIRCVPGQNKDEWDNPPQCTAQCKKPENTKTFTILGEKIYYNVWESVSVRCITGYRPLHEWITCVTGQNKDQWDNPPRCKAQCKKPENTDMFTILGEKTYYNVWESVSVRCKTGYRPLYDRITCVARQNKDQWDNPPQCAEQCKKPSINNLENIAKFEEYYNLDQEITITCKSGYYPSSPSIQCKNNGIRDDWTPTAVCIGVNVTVLEVTSTSVSLRIRCSPDQCHNPWTSYISSCIYLSRAYKGCQIGKEVTFSGLEPVTQYEFLVTRVSGRSSLHLKTLTISTGESVPGAPEIVRTPSMEDGTIVWRLDSDKGIITGFELNIMAWRDYNCSFSINVTERFPPNVTRYNINLQHGTNYTFHLRGFTSVGGGEYNKATLETPIGDPPDPKFEKKDITVQLHPVPDVRGPISHYEIIVSSESRSNTSDCLQVSPTHYNSTPTHYTAALLPAHNLTESITLGDNQQYGGFLNAPLTPDQKYAVYVRVTSKWKQDKASCAFLGFFTAKDPVVSVGYLIAGSVAALLLLLVLLVLAALWRTGYYRKLQRKEEIPLKSGLGKMKDIPVENLLDVVKMLRYKEMCDDEEEQEENANILPVGRYLEYKELPSGLLHSRKIAEAEENQKKNRYKQVVPYDDSRVILRSGPSESDYINASYIDGYRAPKFYIATQGPLLETVADFWSMVWQESSSVIVMLTALEEQNKVKCHCYWPDQTQTYGDITVSLVKMAQTGAIITRSFSLKKVQSTVQMTVEQLQYLEWPDHGVPRTPSGLVQLVEQMNRCNTPGSGPVIVHCSAGIGRTGTFVALDILLKMAQAVRKVNVFGCVLRLRKSRMNMVQNKEQYAFLYDVLLETLLCGTTSVQVPDMGRQLSHMTRRDPRTGMDGYDRQFQALEEITQVYQIYQCKEAKKPENQRKNRNPRILPGDHFRPILFSALAQHGAPGYINAVFVNSNSLDDVVIVTQLPMKETLVDFWSLVWDYKCTSVVMMHRALDLQQVGMHFWPDEGFCLSGDFTITASVKRAGDGYRWRSLSVRRESESSDSRLDVTLWHLDSWPLDQDLPQNPSAIITMIGEVEKCQQQIEGSHILVTCGDGASRSGLFCAGMMLCDQIRSDGIVDVSQAVRSLRKRRCQFIPSKAQFSFCYSLAHTYLDSFETYGNFK
ncbi:receptor-type tyrosine-protein phosphatase T-like [Dendrobates tinctorius]|uniref:receptor-type tyrosine-protein phosphatase T-like n=1 Tax=Dendrobates tinctorius TaxID=92724 RepID=UPI003CC939BF